MATFKPLLLALLLAISAAIAMAAQSQRIEIPLNKSRIIDSGTAIGKVSMGNPNIADIVVLRGNQLYLLGKQLGTTNVVIWDTQNRLVQSMDITVGYDLDTLKYKLATLIPGERIEVHSSQGAIVLSGQVSNAANMSNALAIARTFVRSAIEEKKSEATADKDSGSGKPSDEEDVTSNVVNMLSIGGSQQVMLKVTVAEMSRSTAKRLGIKFSAINNSGKWTTGGVSGGGRFPDALFAPDDTRIPVFGEPPLIGPMIREFLPNDLSIADKGLFASYLTDDFLFTMALEAAKENGTAKILAEPTLTALSGQDASFLSGGEFPIPIPRGDDGVAIAFKEFGVGVKFIPVVLGNGAINLKLNISVTELSDTTAVTLGSSEASANFFIPSLSSRSASTTVELADGQTIGIAGLINENMRSYVSKFPGLGDIPVLGALFRSQSFEKGETELVIMVTPHLAVPMNRKLASLPTDSFVEPSDLQFYLLGKTWGPVPASGGTPAVNTGMPLRGGIEGTFGHDLD